MINSPEHSPTPASATPPPAPVALDRSESATHLLGAALEVASTLDLPEVLHEFVKQACLLTGAKYAALSVLDNRGGTSTFVHYGIPAEVASQMSHPPIGVGIIGEIPIHGGLIIDDVDSHPSFKGFPPGHPAMKSFLGVPVRIHEQVFGRLYMCDAPAGFDDVDLTNIKALAAVAAVAIENSRLYEDARNRERWIRVSQQLTTTLLEGTDEEEALELITRQVREVADADTALIVLPSVGDTWAAEIVDGEDKHQLIGVVFPPQGRAMTVLREGQGMVVDSMARATTMRVPQLGAFGPALYAPLIARRKPTGVLILLRRPGRPEFDTSQLALAESVASQAALALELATARHAEDMANLLEERARIGRDLHDLAIQQLFATGMQLDTARSGVLEAGADTATVVGAIDSALAAVDESVRQIRAIVHELREPDATVAVVERLRRETSLARNSLGFAPSYVLALDGRVIHGDEQARDELVTAIDERIGPDIADDVVAVVREGLSNVARHAHASSVSVNIEVDGPYPDGFVKVTVSDDGRGLDPEQHRRSGLDNLTSRARRHKGSFWIGSNPAGRGTSMEWVAKLG